MNNTPSLTVMQVTPNLEVGGAQENLRTMARYFPAAGCATVVCTFADGPLRRDIEALGVTVEVLPSRRHSVFALPLFAVEMAQRRRELVELVRRHRVDVVQTRGLGTLDFLVMTLRLVRHVQVWWTIENVQFEVRAEHLGRHRWLLRPKRALHRLLYRIGAHAVNGVIVVSDETARSFCEAVGDVGDRLHVVANAADVERLPEVVDRDALRAELGFAPGDHVMTMVGTFKRQKGHEYLVAATAEVAPRDARLHVLLVGDGELLPDIRRRVTAAGLDDRVHFLGTRRDVPALLAASDSFVLPSLWEGLPVALVEAMASGLPVIATEVSGTSQVMVPGRTGWLVPPGDASRLAEAMVALRADPERAQAMAAAGRARVVERFAAHHQAEQLARLFRRDARCGPPATSETLAYGRAR
jgi:glycosyltransferase involved in cell wall biosynthesis